MQLIVFSICWWKGLVFSFSSHWHEMVRRHDVHLWRVKEAGQEGLGTWCIVFQSGRLLHQVSDCLMARLSVRNSPKSCHSCKQVSLPKCVTMLSGWWHKKLAAPRVPSLLMHNLFAMQISPVHKPSGRHHSFSNRRYPMKWQWPQIKLFQSFCLTGALALFPPLQERMAAAPPGLASPAPPRAKEPSCRVQFKPLQTSKETSYLQ